MRILVTGASGQLGAYLIDDLLEAGHEVVAWSGRSAGQRNGVRFRPIDLTDVVATGRAVEVDDPAAILHLAALSATESVRLNPSGAQAINVDATRWLANWSADHGRRFLFTSTDLVFDGSRAWNREGDPAQPILAYGRSKREAEASVLGVAGGLVTRICLLFGPSRGGRPYFFDGAMDAIRRGEPQTFFEDEYRTPLHLATASKILSRLVESREVGLVHVGGSERVSRFELMKRSALSLNLDAGLVQGNRRGEVTLPEARPADVSLDTTRLASILPDLTRPTIEEALRLHQS